MDTHIKEELLKKIDNALDDVRPHLEVDGGNVELVDVNDDLVVTVKWLGNCQGCQMSQMTLKAGLEQAIKNKLPEIIKVNAI